MVEQLVFIAVFTTVELGPVSPIKLRQFQPASHRMEDRLGNGFSHTIKNGNIDGTLTNSILKGTNPLARSQLSSEPLHLATFHRAEIVGMERFIRFVIASLTTFTNIFNEIIFKSLWPSKGTRRAALVRR